MTAERKTDSGGFEVMNLCAYLPMIDLDNSAFVVNGKIWFR